MEGIQQIESASEKPDMGAFREEIARLIDERGNIDVELAIDLGELTEADALMWKRVKEYTEGSVTDQEMENYRIDINSSNNNSRKAFLGTILSNTFFVKQAPEILREMRKNKR